ncbi:SLAM family member 5-like [Cheilinus undulatus]|uniref:SLAM family member 5-like n=1 Tax=Cheilinus undulatus TaxID=241271 RepID=UPI001BD351FF|nr:SLAM family member 5-like [Cheilinus undulatus]
MEKLASFCLLIVLPSAVLSVSLAQNETVYFKEGGDLTLEPRFPDRIVNILWKLKGDLVAEWIEKIVPLEYYGRFKGRTDLDIKTGKLVMRDLTKEDEGLFTLELNSKVQPQRYISKAIKEVLKPQIWMQPVACSPDKHSQCALSCEGDTADAGPVTFSWMEGDKQSQNKENIIQITKADSADVETYTCQMKNPVSKKESDAHKNPFFTGPPPPLIPNAMAVGIPVAVILAAMAAGLGWKFKDKIANFFCPNKQDGVSNGNGANNEENNSTPLTDTNTEAAERL